jgi:hypothetical protein
VADFLKLCRDSIISVAPKPRKPEKIEPEEEVPLIKSCLLRVQPVDFAIEPDEILMHPITMNRLMWKDGNLCSVIPLQKPFSFAILDQQIRQEPGSTKPGFDSLPQRTSICILRESTDIQQGHVALPLEVRFQCLIEERTRILLRFVPSNSVTQNFTPKKIILQEIRWQTHE